VPRRVVQLIVVVTLLVLGAGAWWLLRGPALPEPPRPPTLASVDPLAAELIETLLARTSDAPRDAEQRARLAMAYHANGLRTLAEPTYLQALDRERRNARWWYLLALCRHDLGDHDGALAAVGQAAGLAGSEALVARRRGAWLLQAGQLGEAASSLERALALGPGDVATMTLLARVHLAAVRPDAAAQLLEPIAGAPGADPYVDQLLGQAYHRLGRAELARRRLAGASAEPPAWPDAWADELDAFRRSIRASLEQADALAEAGRFSEAIDRLEALRRRQPRNATVLAKLGETCIAAQRYADARRYLEDAVDADDRYTPAHLHLSRLARETGDLREAARHATRAVRLQPTFGPAHLELANALISEPQPSWPDVERALRGAIRYGAADPDTRLNLALAELQQGRPEEAAATAERVVAGHPYNFRGLMLLTLIHLERRDPDAAEALVRRAAELRPDDPSVRQARDEIAALRRGAQPR
jgi:tetratricopeptide (TPR) repeat protein